ncbi:hypothetical protein JDW19_12835 [Paenibacillus polymyxa]|uniref:Uncharacterized protein n=1 Tax=Paenibacillus polymyxa TaxID=1406 RepID=A0A8I1IT08_PAEPO|nr:hypothetical protein [Paenibacillus polymyxa]
MKSQLQTTFSVPGYSKRSKRDRVLTPAVTPIRGRWKFLLRGHRLRHVVNRGRDRFIPYPQYDGDHVKRSGAKPRGGEWTAVHAI